MIQYPSMGQASYQPAIQPAPTLAQPTGPQTQGQYLADALRGLQASGSQSRTPAALGTNLLADTLLNGAQQKQSYNDQLAANGIDPTLDPDAAPQGLAGKVKGLVGGLFNLGQGGAS